MLINKQPISEIMTNDVVSVTPNTIVTEIVELFDTHKFHHLPVVENGKAIGIISQHDINSLEHHFTHLKLGNYALSNKKFFSSLLASDIMTKKPVCLPEQETLIVAIDMFLENKYHSIIVTKGDLMVGILTPFDILSFMHKKEPVYLI